MIEVREGRASALAGSDPFSEMVARASRDARLGYSELLPSLFRHQARLARHLALVADEDRAVVGEFLACGKLADFARRVIAAVVPEDFARRHPCPGRNVPADDRRRGKHLRGSVAGVLHQFNGFGIFDFQSGEQAAHRVATDIAQGAGAKIPPAAPDERLIDRFPLKLAFFVGVQVRPGGRWSKPGVPIQTGWRRIGACRPVSALRPPEMLGNARPIGPNMGLLDIADGAGPNPLAQPPPAFALAAVVAHLRGDFMFPGRQGKQPGFADVVRQRLFAVNVLAQPNGRHRGHRMMMVGRGDKHGVDLTVHLVEHLPIVGEALGQRPAETVVLVEPFDLSEAAVPGAFNHIANRDQVFVQKRFNVGAAASTHADAGDVELGIGRGSGQDVGRRKELRAGGCRRQGGCFSKELTSVETCGHAITSKGVRLAFWRNQNGGWANCIVRRVTVDKPRPRGDHVERLLCRRDKNARKDRTQTLETTAPGILLPRMQACQCFSAYRQVITCRNVPRLRSK